MTDTEYTKGFLAGMTWSEERIIKLLEQAIFDFEQYDFDAVGLTNAIIELIKGETNYHS